MKFSSFAVLVGLLGVAQASLKVPTTKRELKSSDGSGGSSSTTSEDEALCDNCGTQLPGFTFWGPQYVEENFYQKAITTFLEGSGFTSSSDSDESELNEGGFFDGRGLCLPGNANILGPEIFDFFTQAWCMLLTIVSETVFQSDVLSCLLMSFDKTTKDTICFLQDQDGLPNPDILGVPVETNQPQRKLSETGCNTGDPWLDVNCMGSEPEAESEGRELYKKKKYTNGFCGYYGFYAFNILCVIGITEDVIFAVCDALVGEGDLCLPYFSYIFNKYRRERKLSGTIRPGEESDDEVGGSVIRQFADTFDEIILGDFVYADSEFRLGVGWFAKCGNFFGNEIGPSAAFLICTTIYTLEKTIDAIICQKLQDCDIDEVCDANQNFKTEYNSRRLARQIPSFDRGGVGPSDNIFNFLVADVLAPCLACENQCADLCWYVDNYDQCDTYKRNFIASEFDPFDAFFFKYVEVPEAWFEIIIDGGFPILGPFVLVILGIIITL